MDNTNEQVQVQQSVVNPATAPVSTAEAQRKTAVFIQIFYSFCYFIVGIALAIWGFIWLSKIGIGTDTDTTAGNYLKATTIRNSYFAMGIVGVFLTVWGVLSTALAAAFQIINKSQHHISNKIGGLAWLTLNPASYNLIRHSNGYLSKKEKKKLAAKQAAANSDDSIDPSAQQD